MSFETPYAEQPRLAGPHAELSTPYEELALPFDPTGPTQTLARRRRALRGRVISLMLTVVVMGLIYAWQRAAFTPVIWVIYGVSLAISVGWLVVAFVRHRQARRTLSRMGQGLAVRVGRPGVEVAGLYAPWPEVEALAVVPGGLGRGPELRLQRRGGQVASVAMDQIDVFPATVDSTVRAYSAGRHGVDLSALEN